MGQEPVAREPPLALLLTAGALGRNGLEKNTGGKKRVIKGSA